MATAEDAANWIAVESDDFDGLNGVKGYGWARATTDDVAAGIGVSPEEAYRLLKAAERKRLVTQDKTRRKGVTTKRFGSSQVGWAIWEVHLDRVQMTERMGSAGDPNLGSMARYQEELFQGIRAGEQVSGRTLVECADAAGIEIDPKLVSRLNKPSIWVRPAVSNLSTDAANVEAVALYGALRSGTKLTPNASYYVWVLAPHSDTPLSSEGPYGPHPLKRAEQMARIGATEGVHDRAVSLGRDPEAHGFRIEQRYQARSGKRIV